MKRKEYKKKNRQISNKRLVIKASLLLTLTAFFALSAYGVFLKKKAADAAEQAYEAVENRPKSDLREKTVEPVEDNISVLFIGIDESDKRKAGGSTSLSDALLVATLNNTDKTVKLVSIPRDSYVYIPDRDRKDKITHAHAFGGTRGTIETVETMLEIPIDYYVKMNFNAFIEVVDALGGVNVEVPYKLNELDENDKRTVNLEPGMQLLNGKETLALARTRNRDNDIERGKRQQMILQAIMKEALSVKSITKYADVIDAVGDNMKTNMTFSEMTSFLNYAKGGIPQVDTLNLKGDDDMSTGIYYYLLDEEHLELIKREIQTHLGITSDSSALTDVRSHVPKTNESANK